MSQTKYRLDEDVRMAALAYVRGYERRRRAYLQRRSDIINSSPNSFTTYIQREGGRDLECRQYFSRSNLPSRQPEDKTIRLAALEEHPDVKRMRAVEQAKLFIGDDIINEAVRERLRDAIWINCMNGKLYPYEVFDLAGIGKTNFYERKRKFLHDIAQNAGML